jgi:hypothetical protein
MMAIAGTSFTRKVRPIDHYTDCIWYSTSAVRPVLGGGAFFIGGCRPYQPNDKRNYAMSAVPEKKVFEFDPTGHWEKEGS